MAGADINEQAGPRFDKLLDQLLDGNEGVFLGERHNIPSVRQALTYLAPAMKAKGVTTISFEIDEATLTSALKAKSLDEFLKDPKHTGVPDHFRPDEFYNIVQAYHKLGIKVLGHEMPIEASPVDKAFMDSLVTKMQRIVDGIIGEEQKIIEEKAVTISDPRERAEFKTKALEQAMEKINNKLSANEEIKELSRVMHSYDAAPERIPRRNAYAADYIRKNKLPGKILVIGGENHSRYIKDLKTYVGADDKSEGLDKRLGIPTINLEAPYGSGGEVGSTKMIVAGKAYEVVLPADLAQMNKNYNITHWPPADGVPSIVESAMPPYLPQLIPKKPAAIIR